MGQSASELGAEPPAPAPAPSEPTPEPSTWRSAESEESEATAQALGTENGCGSKDGVPKRHLGIWK